ncbi:ER protein Pkr1-domain-containing protein [Phyllosticta citribraziliensis]|uniref:ER protein Pkr1-domain-containing protein n=1 Tax=Phyllosticta citribraziliensis TaxID=989973 RepID=A0ABR1L7K1_9PEZI
MSQFFENLWNSVFTPGPTPTLLVATNASFAALQLVLFALLLATYSIHFVVLSGLCGGLWWSINWFANELRAATEKEEAAQKLRERREKERERSRDKDGRDEGGREPAMGRDGGEGEGMDTGDDTETETETEVMRKSAMKAREGGVSAESTHEAQTATTTGTQAAGLGVDEALKKRRSVGDGAESSTDSEWEKIEQER